MSLLSETLCRSWLRAGAKLICQRLSLEVLWPLQPWSEGAGVYPAAWGKNSNSCCEVRRAGLQALLRGLREREEAPWTGEDAGMC